MKLGVPSKASLQMKKNLALILILVNLFLIVLNFMFTSDEMGVGFWLGIVQRMDCWYLA